MILLESKLTGTKDLMKNAGKVSGLIYRQKT